LDEPTNDFDIDTLNVLEDFLEAFEGNVMVVSHDRYFLDKVCDHIFAFEENGKIKDYPGNYTDYREWKAQPKDESKPQPKPVVEVQLKAKEAPSDKRKMSFKEKHELEQLTKEIEKLETEKQTLETKLNAGGLPYNELTNFAFEIEKITTQLEENELRWLELSEMV
jgi:ATP-binding cassette subfamily F protein uup